MEVKQDEELADTAAEELDEAELAAEGYRFLSEDTADFAMAVFSLALEVWSEWEVNPLPNHSNWR